MSRIQFGLSGGLSPRDLDTIHQALLQVLDETGMECAHSLTADVLTATEGIRFDNGRIKFSRDLVNETIERARAAGRQRRPAERVRVSAPWNCLNVIDMDDDAIRASTAADVVSMLKLVAGFNEYGCAPVYPCDLDPRVQILWLEKICLELTPGFGGDMVSHDPQTIRWIGRLHGALGRRYPLGLQFLISPLRLDHLALDLLWQFKGDPLVHVSANTCPIPVGGLTAPLCSSALLVQALAESVGGMIVAERLGMADCGQVAYLRADIGDVRHMTIGYSLPENVMVQVLLRDVAERFSGYRMDTIYINTNAKRADALANVDRMAYMLMLGLAGFRNFILGAGQLSMDEVFSPAQFIIDMEIGHYIQHVLDGMPWQGEAGAGEIAGIIAEGVAEGNYLTHPSTLDALPHLFRSRLFAGTNLGQWRAAGGMTIERTALQRAREAIESYQFELEPATRAALNQVFSEACRDLGVDLSTQPIP